MAQLSRGDRLRTLGHELLTLADAVDQPSRCTSRSDMLIAEGALPATSV